MEREELKKQIVRVPVVALVLCLMATLSLAGCKKKAAELVVSDGDLIGLWVKSGTQEYWRYNSDHTGVTWDESEDISEAESNLGYTWTIEQSDRLCMSASGREGNQFVPKNYTITEISSSTMVWDDGYGLTYTLYKK